MGKTIGQMPGGGKPLGRRHLLGGLSLLAAPALPAVASDADARLLAAFDRWFRVETAFAAMQGNPALTDDDCRAVSDQQDLLIRDMAAVPAGGFDGLAVKVALLLHVLNGPESIGDPLILADHIQGEFQDHVLQRSLLADVQARFPELRA